MNTDTTVYNIFTKPIDTWINPVIYFDELDIQDISSEVDSYILPNTPETETSIETSLIQLLQRIKKGMEEQEKHPAIWISGYFGAGKSMLAKLLALSFDERYLHVDGKRISEHFFSKGTSSLQNTWSEIQETLGSCRSILFDIGAKSVGMGTQNNEISDPFHMRVLKEVQKNLGFGKNPHMLKHFFTESHSDRNELQTSDTLYSFHHFLETEGFTQESFFLHTNSFVQGTLFSKFMHQQDEHTFRNDIEWFDETSRQDCNYNVNKVVAYIRAMRIEYMRKNKTKDLHLFIFVDELYQHVYHNSVEVTHVEALAESIGIQQSGKIWLIATAQEQLSNITRDGENEIGKLQDRFPPTYRLHLDLSNIKEVVYQRILAKEMRYCNRLKQDFEDTTVWTSIKRKSWFSKSLTSVEKEDVIKSYPFAPGALDAIFHLTSQIKLISNRSVSDGTEVRGTLQLLNALFRDQTSQGNIRNASFGSWITMHHIYKQQKNSLPKNLVDDVDLHIKEHIYTNNSINNDQESQQLLIAMVKTVALIGLMGPNYPATLDNIVACLNTDYYQTDNSLYEKVETLLSIDSTIFMCIQNDNKDTYSLRSKNLVIVGKEFIKNKVPPSILHQYLEREFNKALNSAQNITIENPLTDYKPSSNKAFIFSYHSKHHKFSMRYSIEFIDGYNIPPLPQFSIDTNNPIEIRNVCVHFWITSNNLEQQARMNSIGNKIIWIIQDSNNSLQKWTEKIAITQSNHDIIANKLDRLKASKSKKHDSEWRQNYSDYNGEKKNQYTKLIKNQIAFYHELKKLIVGTEPKICINGQVHTLTGISASETFRSIIQSVLQGNVIIKSLYPKNEYFSSEDDALEDSYHYLCEDNQGFEVQKLHDIYTTLGIVENNQIQCSTGIPLIFLQALRNINPEKIQDPQEFSSDVQNSHPQSKYIFMVEDIIRFFLRMPYGFSIHTILATIIGLCRAGKMNLIYKKNTLTTTCSFDASVQANPMILFWKTLCQEPFPKDAWAELRYYCIRVCEKDELLRDRDLIQIKQILLEIAITKKQRDNIDATVNNPQSFITILQKIKQDYSTLYSKLRKQLSQLSPYIEKIPELNTNTLDASYQLIHNVDINEGTNCLRDLLSKEKELSLLKANFVNFAATTKDFIAKYKNYKQRTDFEEINRIFIICHENLLLLKGYIPENIHKNVLNVLQHEFEFWSIPTDISFFRSTKDAIEKHQLQFTQQKRIQITEKFETLKQDIQGSLQYQQLFLEHRNRIDQMIETQKSDKYDVQILQDKNIAELIHIYATLSQSQADIERQIQTYLEEQDKQSTDVLPVPLPSNNQNTDSSSHTVTCDIFGDKMFFEDQASLLKYLEEQEEKARSYIQLNHIVRFL